MFYFALEQLNKINSVSTLYPRLALSLTICLVGCNLLNLYS